MNNAQYKERWAEIMDSVEALRHNRHKASWFEIHLRLLLGRVQKLTDDLYEDQKGRK